MVFNATFNTISVISRRSVLLVEQSGVPRERPSTYCTKGQAMTYKILHIKQHIEQHEAPGVNQLLREGKNKCIFQILDEGALPIFLEVLKLELLEEQALTSRILWTMSFDGYVAKEIKSNKELMEKLQSLSQSGDKAVNMNVRGLLYTLNNLDTKSKGTCIYILPS